MYMSASRTGATELPREVAFQSQAAAAAGSLACIALANSCWPGSGLDLSLGLATAGGGSLAGSVLAAAAAVGDFGCVTVTGGADAVTVSLLSVAGEVCGARAGEFGCC